MFTTYRKNDFHPQKMNNDLYCPREVEVYDVHIDKTGCPQFLIYEDKEWKCCRANLFTPDPAESRLFNCSPDKPVENFYETGEWHKAICYDV